MTHVLFVCRENAGRSQMASALFDERAGGRHAGSCAGTTPAAHVHPTVVEALREVGIDVAARSPQPLTPQLAQGADVVVTMGCGDACPVVPGKRRLDWDLPDPHDRPLSEVRAIRDEIGARVAALVIDLDAHSGE